MSRMNCLEEDLYEPVKAFLEAQQFEVRSEVHHCDVTAVKDDQLVIVELKRHLSVDLLAQGVLRQKMGDTVYLAVPKPKNMLGTGKWKDICHLLRRLELGLLLVSLPGHHRSAGTHGFVEVAVQPEAFDREKSRRASRGKKNKLLIEHQSRKVDLNRGGSTRKKLVTAYREQAIRVACYLESCGPLTAKMIKERGVDSPKIASILKSDYYGWFQKLGGGFFALNPTGMEELKLYSELTSFYREELKAAGANMAVVTLDLRDAHIASEIIRVQKRAYLVEAELISFSDIPQLGENAEELALSGETFIGCYAAGGVLAAFLSYKVEVNMLDIHRLCVDPDYFRRGLGRNLMAHVLEIADQTHVKGAKKNRLHRVVVTAAELNEPAVNLYTHMGFKVQERFKVHEHLAMVDLISDRPSEFKGSETQNP